jgi:hypothetical protein
MNRLILFIFILFLGISVYSQNNYITGCFYINNNGTYFMGTNQTQYALPIKITAVNETKNQQRFWTINLQPYSSFTINKDNGWIWEAYEKLYITFNNGQSIYWVFSPKNTSFKGLIPKKSCQIAGCNCMKYMSEAGSDYPYGTWCKKCNHSINYHTK